MARQPKIYRRLPGRPFTGFVTRMLWQGPDHLLAVERTLGQETYKRFYYNDIQAVVMQRTQRHQLWNAIWGIVALLFGLIALGASEPAYFSGFMTVLGLILLAGNLILGPACEVYLQTAVQRHRLATLRRVRTGRNVMARIRVLIEGVQGPLGPALAVDLEGTTTPRTLPPNLNASSQPAAARNAAEPPQPFKPLLHRLLFGMMLAAGLLRAIRLWMPSMALMIMDLFLLAGLLALAIAALAQWNRQIKGTRVGALSWLSLGLLILHGLGCYVMFVVVFIRNPESVQNNWLMLELLTEFQASGPLAVLVANQILTAANLMLGAVGLIALRGAAKSSTLADTDG